MVKLGFRETAYKYAVKNAFLHGGKAELGAVVGKVVALHKGIDVGKSMPEIKKTIEHVNKMPFAEIQKEYERMKGEYELKPKPKQEGLKDIGVKGEVVTRFAPNPSGPMHLGHCRAALFSYWYAEKYGGKFLLRFDDTDPKTKKPVKEAKDSFLEDLGWLGVKRIDKIVFASDRLERYCEVAGELIEKGKAYVCKCKTETWRNNAKKSLPCPCREKEPEEHAKRWRKMLAHELKEGQAVLRLKTDLCHKDPSQRDWWMAKIVDEPEHTNPKAKSKHVWPSYNLASAIDEHDLGITLIIRGQEHSQNETKQKFLYEYMKWEYPRAIHFGKIMIEGIELSKSRIAKGVEEGKYTGMDDPRIGTVQMMRKRGFEPEAIANTIMSLGIRPNDAAVSIDALYETNRKMIDRKSDRLSFVSDPAKLEVQFSPKTEASVPVHPDCDRGEKVYELAEGTQSFTVSKKEMEQVRENEVFRVRNAYNVKMTGRDGDRFFAQFVSMGKMDKKTVHWLLDEHKVDAEIIMPDSTRAHGLTEEYALEKAEGDMVLLEKLGYAKIESVNQGLKLMRAYYTHR